MNQLKKYRLEKGLTLKELAQAIGLTRSGLGHLERGFRRGKMSTWVAISKVLNVAIDDLVKSEEKK